MCDVRDVFCGGFGYTPFSKSSCQKFVVSIAPKTLSLITEGIRLIIEQKMTFHTVIKIPMVPYLSVDRKLQYFLSRTQRCPLQIDGQRFTSNCFAYLNGIHPGI